MTPAFKHQTEITNFILSHPATFCTSDPGTGKTRAVIDAIKQIDGRVLVLAPKSILSPSWGNDLKKFAPDLLFSIAYAENRMAAFEAPSKVVITNHDAVVWILKSYQLLKNFELLVVDESTAYKNPNAQRSKALARLAAKFSKKVLLTGTPTPNGILDIWHQVFILDQGERLTSSFWKFRAATHEPKSRGQFTEWEEKPEANDAVYGLINDINIRFKLEDCLDMPEVNLYTVKFNLNPKHLALYKKLKRERALELQDQTITAINAAALNTKLLQCAAGSIYDQDGNVSIIDTDRYDLILDLISQRDQCLVAFMWKHQRDALVDRAKKVGINFAVIDGEVPAERRSEIVDEFQNGEIKVIFAHPASASHGLTLTAATTTIWASPTYNGEQFTQFNRRIYRVGQTKRTETILIAATGTVEETAYARLQEKIDQQQYLLELLNND